MGYCAGKAIVEYTDSNCYERDDRDPALYPWVQYECEYAREYSQPLQSSTSTGNADGNVDTYIVLAIFSMVGIIGIMVGYLLYTKRKKSAEKLPLFDATHANASS